MPSKFYNDVTIEACNKLLANPFVNPLTNRKITSIEKVYSMCYACHKKFGREIPEVVARARAKAKADSRQHDWNEGMSHENMKYEYAKIWGERWHPDGVGRGANISRANAVKEENEYYDRMREGRASPPRQRPPPPPQQPRAQAAAPKKASLLSESKSKENESAEKRLQYCKKLSKIAMKEKNNKDFIERGMDLARRYGYAAGNGAERIHLRKAMQLVCHPDKYANTLSPSKKNEITEYIQIINNRLENVK